jgi:hypothetical protein
MTNLENEGSALAGSFTVRQSLTVESQDMPISRWSVRVHQNHFAVEMLYFSLPAFFCLCHRWVDLVYQICSSILE